MFETKPLTEKDNVRGSCDSTFKRAVEDDQFDTKLNEDLENPWNPKHQRLTVLGDVKCHPSISQRDSERLPVSQGQDVEDWQRDS